MHKKGVVAMAKVALAAAWLDGELTEDERNALKELMDEHDDLDEATWQELEPYLEQPVSPAEREAFLADLKEHIASDEDKHQAVAAISRLIQADKEISDDEREVAQDMMLQIDNMDIGIFTRLSKLIRGKLS